MFASCLVFAHLYFKGKPGHIPGIGVLTSISINHSQNPRFFCFLLCDLSTYRTCLSINRHHFSFVFPYVNYIIVFWISINDIRSHKVNRISIPIFMAVTIASNKLHIMRYHNNNYYISHIA